MCLFSDVGSIYTPVEFSALYLCTLRLGVVPIPCQLWGLGATDRSRTIPIISSAVMVHEVSGDGLSPSHIGARFAASPSNRVSWLCLQFPRSFRQFLARVHCLSD